MPEARMAGKGAPIYWPLAVVDKPEVLIQRHRKAEEVDRESPALSRPPAQLELGTPSRE